VEIIAEVSMPCPPCGSRDLFRTGTAFLCHFEDLPFRNNGINSFISGFTIIGDYPRRKLEDWVEDTIEAVDDDWNEADLFSKSPEEAVAAKIKDLKKIWSLTSLHTLCQFCKAKGDRCQEQLESLI